MIYIVSFAFSFLMLYYLALVLQLNNYKFKRVLFNFSKKRWHFYYLIAPFLLYVITCDINHFLALGVAIIYLLALIILAKNIDKPLVFTARIKRLFLFNLLGAFVFTPIHFYYKLDPHTLDIIIFAFLLSYICEYFVNKSFYNKAYNKISNLKDCKVVLITASYGKTSIKHYLASITQNYFKIHYAKGSINTLLGLIKDINENLDPNTNLLIIEAGARKKGDIEEITKLVRPHYVIIGQIGTAHLEYFKNIENTKEVKKEALKSTRLELAITHSSVGESFSYDSALSEIKASLDGLSFKCNDEKYFANLLGSFNASNLCACIYLAKALGLNYEQICKEIANLKATEHRLQIISREPKFIIDDGFNGNYDGMSDSYRIIKDYNLGKKVLVSPGIIEASEELNKKLCEVINECFDLAIITSETNARIYDENLKIKKIILKDKAKLIETLANETKEKDLIIFSNDAPNFI
ncbi:UDP-N-acetylmuramoyl-tripeptide--D-alanyl-D-alanine ligase [Campylobacter sp. RM9334]|uniref:UDP-N-acetylmuramoyl-tripeptide--D-alanyl-D- alanine ligase n=1 Tax=Campylobacter sp. RM9334 TaxID=2735732 RepID=UPI001DC63BE6|nr:UDP-N-acetylmuramoyl-tripeptide--D-alanyl-D-alanine ligase [Campylobacter sp. RM9334]